jgi:hypothetical protein
VNAGVCDDMIGNFPRPFEKNGSHGPAFVFAQMVVQPVITPGEPALASL